MFFFKNLPLIHERRYRHFSRRQSPSSWIETRVGGGGGCEDKKLSCASANLGCIMNKQCPAAGHMTAGIAEMELPPPLAMAVVALVIV